MTSLLLIVIYIAFIGLGLPDSLLGSVWPTVHIEIETSFSNAGIISMIIAFGTVTASLLSDRLTFHLGAKRVTAFSTLISAISLFGFSQCTAFWQLCLWSVPFGLAAGSIDAALNNYVALHYSSRHMSWLHCMWGVGTIVGPVIMGAVLSGGRNWSIGYILVSIIQIVISAIILMSFPLWKKREGEGEKDKQKPLTFKEIFAITGVSEVLIAFFCYCAMEQTAMLWAGTYLVFNFGISSENAATLSSLLFIGITVGRAICGFLTIRFKDKTLIIVGETVCLAGIIIMMLPLGSAPALIGLIMLGLGCAPIYPCIIHSTPALFGEKNSQAIIGVQMASAYIGILLIPALFGVIAKLFSMALFPYFLLVFLLGISLFYKRLLIKTKN